MANHKSALKRIRQTQKRREQNRYYAKTTRNAIRDIRNLTDKAEAEKRIPEVFSMIDKLAKRGVIHKKNAANKKSSIANHINKLN